MVIISSSPPCICRRRIRIKCKSHVFGKYKYKYKYFIGLLLCFLASASTSTIKKSQEDNKSNLSETFQSTPKTSSSSFEGKNEKIENGGRQREDMSIHEMETALIRGFRVEESSKPVSYKNSASVILAYSDSVIRIFGERFTNNTIIRFVTQEMTRGMDCDDLPSTKSFMLNKDEIAEHSATVTIHLPQLNEDETAFYFCAKEVDFDMPWVHQGPEKWLILKTYKKWLPLWAHILLLITLLALSGVFSGLNLGLISMDRTELKIIENTGTKKERSYAKKIRPLRNKGNYLLCSLLLGNVMVNSTLTILLDDLTTGLIAVIGSTMGIVFFGEIIPQAFCSRYGLAVGAHTVLITKLTMAITFPLSYPVSFILDKILGKEIGNVYNRERLRELIKVTENYNDLKKDEVDVIEGVLKLSQLTCADAMTKLDKVFMLPLNGILDFETIDEIMKNGYSRIPIYDGNRSNVISLLYTKDLAFVDPDDKMPIKSICEFYQYPCNFVDDKKHLDCMLKEFQEGSKGHMAFVQRMNVSDNSDPFYEVVGVVTLEDVIEELIQSEINDETDVQGNRHRRRSRVKEMPGFIGFKNDGTIVSPQLTFAAYQYLSASIPAFHSKFISNNILQRLLGRDVFYKIKLKIRESLNTLSTDPSVFIFEKGKPADYFALILEGRVQAEMGKEGLIFEGGPFTYFGTQCLTGGETLGETPGGGRKFPASLTFETIMQTACIPDYTVRAVTDVIYLKISRSMYVAAAQATILEQSHSPDNFAATDDVGDKFDEQIGKIINDYEKERISNENICDSI